MDALRAVQLLTDLAYLALGIAAVAAALRSHERTHVDVAILFGALAITTGLQEIRLLSCYSNLGCVSLPLGDMLSTILILVVPYALLRLLDDVADVPRWQMWLSLVFLIALAALLILGGGSPPPLLIALLTVYLVVGTCYTRSPLPSAPGPHSVSRGGVWPPSPAAARSSRRRLSSAWWPRAPRNTSRS
jgi:hypothetical protein